MGIFNRKNCDICGEKPGLTGARKLEDGNMCGKCTKKLSPFTTDRKKTSLADIKDHLAYREANIPKVAEFRVSRQLGGSTKVLIDESGGTFIVTPSNKWQSENPDVINISQVISCSSDVRETRNEIKMQNAQGKTVSYRPPRYEYEYDFYINIQVNSPYFNQINFKLNNFRVDRGTGIYRDMENQVYDIQQALQPRQR